MENTLKKSDFLIPYTDSEGKTKTTAVKGRKQTICGVVCYIHKSMGDLYWVVSHFESGMQITERMDRRVAISEAKSILEKHKDEADEKVRTSFKHWGFSFYPLNKLK